MLSKMLKINRFAAIFLALDKSSQTNIVWVQK